MSTAAATDTQPTPDETTRSRIVVGVDGSEPSKQALRWAQRLAAGAGAQLEAVIAWQYPVMTGWGPGVVPLDYNLAQTMDKVLIDTVDAVFGSDRPTGLKLTVVEGHPVSVLLDRSADALMLVVGSRGHGGFIGLLLGSVSASVAEHASCPVLVVHGDQLPDAI